MIFRNTLLALLGDVRFIYNITLPPCFVIGQIKRRIDLSSDYRAASRLLRPGDILVSRAFGQLSNLGIPGATKHALFYVGPVSGRKNSETGFIEKPKPLPAHCGVRETPYPRTIIHSISDGIVAQDLIEIMAEEDYMIAYRPKLLQEKPELAAKMVEEACRKVGMPYDFGFNWLSHNAMCCSEFVDHLSLFVGIPTPPKIKKRVKLFGAKQDVTIADAYALIHPAVWCSVSCNEPSFANRSSYAQILRDRIYEAEDADSLETKRE